MQKNIESHLVEKRVFKPAKSFSAKARLKTFAQYQRMHRESIKHPEKFWAREASELVWSKRWRKVAGMETAVREMVPRRQIEHR